MSRGHAVSNPRPITGRRPYSLAAIQRPITICDFSPLYCEAGGGIRTYHRARLSWFAAQSRHRYVLIAPGPQTTVERVSDCVLFVRVFGARLTGDVNGYRLMLRLPTVRSAIRDLAPDVLETGDPWISGPLGLTLRRRGWFAGLVTSFYHSDPITTYIAPWLGRRIGRRSLRAPLLHAAERGFYRLQRVYDLTLAASRDMRARLEAHDVPNVVPAPVGADPLFFEVGRQRSLTRRARLLYAGRLDGDKEAGLLLAGIERALERPGVTVSVAGRGRWHDRFAAISHPRFTFHGYIADRVRLARLYASHDVFLAPGRYETFGLAALEAAAAGLVVVGPDRGGTAELLQDMRSPFRFPAGDLAGFVASLFEAIDGGGPEHVDRARTAAAAYGTWADAVERQVALYAARVDGIACR